ncbi:helix-turn-helix domain-containing protein [Nocardia aurea]|nr:LysR family transcriptional regulator [Nocardia aurea]
MPNGSLDLLRTFLAVHRTGSFTATAEQVGLSRPIDMNVKVIFL